MDTKEIKNKSDIELNKLIAEKQEAVRAFRFATSGSKTKNVREARTNRREIARLLTELSLRAKNLKH